MTSGSAARSPSAFALHDIKRMRRLFERRDDGLTPEEEAELSVLVDRWELANIARPLSAEEQP
jgi:hypothetical protein